MNLYNLLRDGEQVGLRHAYHLSGRRDPDTGDFQGFELWCGGNFVYFNPDPDEVLERYTRQVTRNPNT